MIRRILSLPAGRFACGFLAFVLVLAVAGPALAPYDPIAGTDDILAHPTAAHWLGTDYLGRDVLSRILSGSTVSIFGAALVALVALVAGALPGILSVYLGRAFEWLSLRWVDTLIALPFLVFAVAVTALLGNGIVQAMLVVGVMVSPLFFRVSRAATLRVARSQYVEAAILSGAGTGWVVRHHVLSKVLSPIAVATANTLGVGFVIVSSLTFLGIGVEPPSPTWGGVLASDLGYLAQRPYSPLFTTVLIMLTVWAFNLLADVIRDVAGEEGRALLADRRARSRRGTRDASLALAGRRSDG
ncbi:MAG: ABC transporter permease [Microbacterium sp.]